MYAFSRIGRLSTLTFTELCIVMLLLVSKLDALSVGFMVGEEVVQEAPDR